jgi:vacuolar-type H+-ATPase subunit C/Vma6
VPDIIIDAKYSFITSYLKASEAQILDQGELNRLAAASSVTDALRTISDTDIGTYLEDVPLKSAADLDYHLWKYFSEIIGRVETFNFVPDDLKEMLNAYLEKYDVFNIKIALAGLVTGEKINMIPVGTLKNRGLLSQLASSSSVNAVVQTLIDCSLHDYAEALSEYSSIDLSKNIHKAEMAVEEAYYNHLLSLTNDIKDKSVLPKVFRTMIDIQNLQVASRAVIQKTGPSAADYMISGGNYINRSFAKDIASTNIEGLSRHLDGTPYENLVNDIALKYEQTKKITSVDEVLDKYRFIFLKDLLSPQVFMPAMVIWYVILKELEMRNLRLVFKALIDDIPTSEVIDYLVFV